LGLNVTLYFLLTDINKILRLDSGPKLGLNVTLYFLLTDINKILRLSWREVL